MTGASGSLWLVGAGNMGGALLDRWRAGGLHVEVGDPRLGLRLPAAGAPETVVLAVKPQAWQAATAVLGERIGAGTLVVSIMAGVPLAALADRFSGATVARAMPNTSAAIGRGITGLFSDTAGVAERERLDRLFALAGATVWLDREGDFDALTALSGSGPAYVFAFVEALAAAGATAGLPAPLALRLATATVTGAAALVAGSADAAALRAAVTSPNGTTAAGLAVLMPPLGPLLRETVAAAAARSRALASAEQDTP